MTMQLGLNPAAYSNDGHNLAQVASRAYSWGRGENIFWLKIYIHLNTRVQLSTLHGD